MSSKPRFKILLHEQQIQHFKNITHTAFDPKNKIHQFFLKHPTLYPVSQHEDSPNTWLGLLARISTLLCNPNPGLLAQRLND